MRFDSAEDFSYYTTSGAATCSFNMTGATRQILINNICVWSDLSNAVCTIQASGTTKWAMPLGSAGYAQQFAGLTICNDAAQSLSANVTATGSAVIAICGLYRYI